MPVVQMRNGVSIRTYEPSPADFDPLTAPDSLLLRYGFPSRPDARQFPELRKRWERELSRKMNYIVPTFHVVEGKTHGPGRASEAGASGTSTNWSGSVALVPSAGDSFQWIEGRWTVPNPYPSTSDGIWDWAAEWIGIDGWNGSGDVLQAGTETDALFANGSTQRDCYVWWEWFHPGDSGEVRIDNFPVSPGDVIYCLLCVHSTTSGSFFIRNVSSGNSTSFTVTAAPGVSLVGNSAEWIVERPTALATDSLSSLADYGMVYFDESDSFRTGTSGSAKVDLGSGTFLTMVDNNNTPLSVPTDESATSMEVNWEKAN
jgi:Peptidase A4 family